MNRSPGLAGIGALVRSIVLSDIERGRMSRDVHGYIIHAVPCLVRLRPAHTTVS